MSTGNPLEQIRRRMQSHATPTAFAALAEEHRRAGRLAEAVAVCREGLERYPAYVSGRVTLGRALLDSGDAVGAVTELEHAVAQSPDNLAAARALETARAALGDVPWPPVPVAAVDAADLLLRVPDGETVSIPPSVVADARAVGQAGPQEFDPAGSDWSVPDSLPPLPVTEAPALDDDWHTGSPYAHTGSPTIDATPTNRQDEDPSGMWQAPAAPSDAAPDATDGAFEFSWFLDPPSSAMLDEEEVAERFGPDVSELPAVSDALTIDTTVAEAAASHDDDVIAAAAEDVPVVADGVLDVPIDDDSSSFWAGSYGGEPVTDAPAPFAGWGEDAPAGIEKTDQSAWADEGVADATGTWTTPDGPSAAWALGDLEADGADPTPFQGTLDVEDTRPRPFAGITEASDWADAADATSAASLTESAPEALASPPPAIEEGVTLLPEASEEAPEPWLAEWTDSALEPWQAAPLEETSELRVGETPDEAAEPLLVDTADTREPVPVSIEPVPATVAWSGSVKSALGEVFALAGHGESLEPPAHPSPLVRDAMADTAVEAAIEDAVRPDEQQPIRASLEQMLAAVRARRAALSGALDS